MSNDGRTQGTDVRGDAFKKSAALLYAAEAAVSGGYTDQSRMTAAMAELGSGGLRGKTVLDLGCGYGTTTLALMRHAPAKIIAVDTSPAHLELMRVLVENGDLNGYLESVNAREVLGGLYDRAVRHFGAMRAEISGGAFRKAGGTVEIIEASSLALPEHLQQHEIDAAVGNNWLHWPINQRRALLEKEGKTAEEAFFNAFTDALDPVDQALKPDGTLTVLEPLDFSFDDTDARWNEIQQMLTMANHPVYHRCNARINELLKSEHSIERKSPKTVPMFPKSRMGQLFNECGFTLDAVCGFEGTFISDALDAMQVRMPMWLGAVDLPMDVKMELIARVAAELRETLSGEELLEPVRGEYTIYTASRD